MQKLFQATCLAIATLGLSATAQAFTVENMSAWSAAKQPLRMDIELGDLAITNANEVQVRVASEAEHARLGLTRPSWGDNVRFQMITLPNFHVVARATTADAFPDERVSFVVNISTAGEGRLQQVGSALGLQPIAAKNPPPERPVIKITPEKKPVEVVDSKPAASNAVKPVSIQSQAKPYNPTVESVAPVAKAEASKPAAEAPAPSKKPAAKPVTPVAKKPAEVAAAPAVAAKPVQTAQSSAPTSSQDRATLEQGLKAAKAQVADLEAQIAAFDSAAAKGAATKEAAAANVTADVDSAATDGAVVASTDDMFIVESDAATENEVDAETANAQAVAAATVVSDETLVAPVTSTLKPYQWFARIMVLFVLLILLVFFLIDKIRNRR
ncbi:hypothetical protein ACFQ0F_03130 [Paraperlucidibaca wandonensis]|uniref:FimV N-terminal domain-containing protein n=1 Tax=Paraperlucidibaca wandonensis TaxID=1268273 RepID=A0ABW3HDU5_9GAMM